jgi:hypothetical protein
VRISETDDLAGIAWIGENFLISGEAGIENDFTAAARDSAGRAAVKYAPVLERENGGSVLNVRQWILRLTSFVVGLGGGQRTEVVHGPVSKYGTTVDELAGDRSKYAGIVGTDAMVAHDEITASGNFSGGVVANVGVLRWDVGLSDLAAVDIHDATANFDGFARKGDDAFDKRFGTIEWIPENDDVTTVDGLEAVNKLVDKNALLIGEQRGHASAFDLHWLIEEDDDDEGETNSDEEIAGPNANLMAKELVGGRRGRIGNRGGRRP